MDKMVARQLQEAIKARKGVNIFNRLIILSLLCIIPLLFVSVSFASGKYIESLMSEISFMSEYKNNSDYVTKAELVDVINELEKKQAVIDNKQQNELIQKAQKAVFVVKTDKGIGAAVAVSDDLIVICRHAAGYLYYIKDSSGKQIYAVPEKKSDSCDLAAYRVVGEKLAYCLPLASSVLKGEKVFIIGHPTGELTYSATSGIISNEEVKVEGQKYFQIDASINRGNSGGPVINSAGELVGIVSRKVNNSEGIGLAVPVNEIREFAF